MVLEFNFQSVKAQVYSTLTWLIVMLGLNFLLIFAPNYFMIAAAAPYLDLLAFLTQQIIYILIVWFLITVFLALITALQKNDKEDFNEW